VAVNDPDPSVFSKLASAVFALAVGLYVAARLWNLTAYSLFPGEVFSVRAARHDWSGMIAFLARDIVHPPLFYLLLKAWIGIGGESLLWLKLFPVLISIATIFPFFLLCRELRLRAAGINLALVLMAANGYLIFYAQGVRMYSLLLLLTVCSMWLFVRFFNSAGRPKHHLVALFAVNLLLVYTQYYGWLVVCLEGIFLLFWGRHKLRPFAISVAGMILCFSPWVYTVAQVSMPQLRERGLEDNLGWLGRPTLLGDLRLYYVTLNGHFHFPLDMLQLLLFGVPVLLWVWHVLRSQGKDPGQATTFWWLFLLSFLPAVLSYAASQVLPQSVWHPRYLIIVAAPYMILVVIAIGRLRPSWVRTATTILMVSWAILAGFKALNEDNAIFRVKWEYLVRQMIQAEPPGDNNLKVYAIHSLAPAVSFYLEQAHETRFQVEQKELSEIMREDTTAQAGGDHFWVAGFFSKHPVQKALIEGGYQVGEGFEDRQKAFLFPVWRRSGQRSVDRHVARSIQYTRRRSLIMINKEDT